MSKLSPFAHAMPQFIDTLVALLTAGHSPPHALRASAEWAGVPMSAALVHANQQLVRGVRYTDVLEQLRTTFGAPSYAVVDALLASDRRPAIGASARQVGHRSAPATPPTKRTSVAPVAHQNVVSIGLLHVAVVYVAWGCTHACSIGCGTWPTFSMMCARQRFFRTHLHYETH